MTVKQLKRGDFFTLKPIEFPKNRRFISVVTMIEHLKNTSATNFPMYVAHEKLRAIKRYIQTLLFNGGLNKWQANECIHTL